MATMHAAPGEVVDLATWGTELSTAHSKTIARTGQLELAHMVLAAGAHWHEHLVRGPVVIHCLTGRIRCRIGTEQKALGAGQLMYLSPGQSHALHAETDSTLLLTVIFG